MTEAVKVGQGWEIPTDQAFSLHLKSATYTDCSFVGEHDGVLTFDHRELGRYYRVQCLVDEITTITAVPPPEDRHG